MPKRLLYVVIIISLIISAGTLRRGHEWGDDFASYIMQAKSIVDGTPSEFVEHNSFTIFQSSIQIGPVAYPWGYPLILTPVYMVKGINPLALKLPGLFFYAGFLICLYLMMVSRLTRTESLLLVSIFAFNPLLIQFLDQILSDIPFLFFSTLSLLLITKENKRMPVHYVLIGASMFFTVFIRTTGIVLLGVFLIIELYRLMTNRQNRTVFRQIVLSAAATCGVFAVLWIVNIVLFPGGSESYFAQYAGISLETVGEAMGAYFNVFSLFFGDATGWKYLYYVLVIFFLLGTWHRHKDEPAFILFFIIWMLVHVTWPAWQGARFIFPLLPIFMYFTFQGMKLAINSLPETFRPQGQSLFYAFWLVIAGIFLFSSSVNAYVNLQNNRAINGPFDAYSREVYGYMEETPAKSVIVFFKPRAMRLMTDHDTFMSMECDRILKGDYLVLSRKVGKNQQIPPEEIGACNLPLNEVLKNSRFIVYQIVK